MTPADLEGTIVRYGDLRRQKTVTIEDHARDSEQKEYFRIIGGSANDAGPQFHVAARPGFSVHAEGQPPKCPNALHSHRTAEVFFVLSGRWRFVWGRHGTAGEVVLEEGDIFNVPTGIFRGFENIGTDYGMIMSILGGDDSEAGVIWAPQAIEEARARGIVLGQNGQLFDLKAGEQLPEGVRPMPLLSEDELKAFPEPPASEVVPSFVARYWDMMAMAGNGPVRVIGPDALLKDRPGFEVDFLTRGSIPAEAYTVRHPEAMMVVNGHWRVSVDGASAVLAPGDTMLVLPHAMRTIEPSMTGQAAMYRVRATDDPAGPTMQRPSA